MAPIERLLRACCLQKKPCPMGDNCMWSHNVGTVGSAANCSDQPCETLRMLPQKLDCLLSAKLTAGHNTLKLIMNSCCVCRCSSTGCIPPGSRPDSAPSAPAARALCKWNSTCINGTASVFASIPPSCQWQTPGTALPLACLTGATHAPVLLASAAASLRTTRMNCAHRQ